jgi:hypothetical protein
VPVVVLEIAIFEAFVADVAVVVKILVAGLYVSPASVNGVVLPPLTDENIG